MARVIKLSRLLRRHERELEWYKEAVRLGYPGAQYQEMNLASLMQTLKLAQSLISQGFDEVLVTKFFDDLGDEPGWLPVKGWDFIRLVKAFGEALAAPDTGMWMNNLTPYIRILEGQVYAEWPTWMGPELMNPYHRALIRLDDADEGEKFTDRVLLERPGEDDAVSLQIPIEKVVRWFRRVSLRDYLELAAAVNGYAVSVYRRAGFPLQMLSPVLPPNTLGVYLSRQGRPHATPLGYIVPYDARFKEVIRAFKPSDGYIPASKRRVAIVKMQAFGTRVG